MADKHRETKDRNRHTTAANANTSHLVNPAQKTDETLPDRTAGQNEAVDQKRNDEQQSHAGGVAHDPHNRTQECVDSGNPDAGDVDEETRSADAPFNKTYGHHE